MESVANLGLFRLLQPNAGRICTGTGSTPRPTYANGTSSVNALKEETASTLLKTANKHALKVRAIQYGRLSRHEFTV